MGKQIDMWRRPEGYGIADLHIHSSIVDGMASVYQIMEYVEYRTELDVIAITDHDDIRGSYQARELAARNNYRFEVVVGMEVTTLHGTGPCSICRSGAHEAMREYRGKPERDRDGGLL